MKANINYCLHFLIESIHLLAIDEIIVEPFFIFFWCFFASALGSSLESHSSGRITRGNAGKSAPRGHFRKIMYPDSFWIQSRLPTSTMRRK